MLGKMLAAAALATLAAAPAVASDDDWPFISLNAVAMNALAPAADAAAISALAASAGADRIGQVVAIELPRR